MTISAINLGNTFTNTSGTTVLGGLSSGLDTQSVINSLVAAQSAQITPLSDQVTVNSSKASAITQLQTLLTDIQSAASALSDPQSPDSTQNVFAERTSTITSNTSQAASNFLSATVADNTASGTYTISNITQLATATVQQTGAFALTSPDDSVVSATATAGEFTAGTFSITKGSTSTSITLTAGESLTDVAAAFNNTSSSTGVSATVLETSSGHYSLILQGTTTGAANGFDFRTVGSDSSGSGSSGSNGITITDSSGVLGNINFTNDQTAQDAQFELNGVSIDRSTNTVSDLISGVTLNLLQNTSTEPTASFTLSVTPNASAITSDIANFANAYNNFLSFYSKQTALNSSGVPASSAILYSDTALQSVYSQLSTQIASLVTGGTNSDNSLAAIGITFTDLPASSTTPAINNALTFDTSTLQSSISSNLSAIENVFGYNLTSSSSDLASYQNATDPTVSSFSLAVNQTSSPSTYVGTYTDSSGNTQTVNFTASSLGTDGVSLTADPSSALAGMILIYTGTGNATITVKTSNGIASQVNNFLTSALAANTGLIAEDQTAIAASTTSLNTQITNITKQVATSRAQLLAQYSALEEAITAANSSLNYLNAQQSAQTAGG
jgi:flagellar hook-associated protein 2